jgi:hypothetical protein
VLLQQHRVAADIIHAAGFSVQSTGIIVQLTWQELVYIVYTVLSLF